MHRACRCACLPYGKHRSNDRWRPRRRALPDRVRGYRDATGIPASRPSSRLHGRNTVHAHHTLQGRNQEEPCDTGIPGYPYCCCYRGHAYRSDVFICTFCRLTLEVGSRRRPSRKTTTSRSPAPPANARTAAEPSALRAAGRRRRRRPCRSFAEGACAPQERPPAPGRRPQERTPRTIAHGARHGPCSG